MISAISVDTTVRQDARDTNLVRVTITKKVIKPTMKTYGL
jgi:hypothetical protein